VKAFRQISIAIFVLSLTVVAAGGSTTVQAQSDTNHAGLVIAFPDGTTRTFCIPFVQPEISGLDVLTGSGLDVKVQAYGGLGAEVCEIGSAGCDYPAQSCACQSYGPDGVYWSYFHLKGGKWQTSVVGTGSYQVHDGDVEGWAYSAGKPPALYTFAQLCSVAPPPPQPAATNTALPAIPTQAPATAVPRLPAPSPTARRATQTPRLAPPTHTQPPGPTPAQLTEPPPTATAQPPTPAPTATPTTTSTPTPTVQAPAPTPSATPDPTQTLPAPTPTIRNPQSAIRNPEDAARTVGIAIGAIVLGSLAIWGIMAVARRGSKGGDGSVE
jgi:hypothetical protein